MTSEEFGHESLFGPTRANPETILLTGKPTASRTSTEQMLGRTLRLSGAKPGFEGTDVSSLSGILQVDTDAMGRDLNLLPILGVSPGEMITGSAPQAGQSPENVYVHDPTVDGSLVEEIIPVGKVGSEVVAPLFEIVGTIQQPQQQGETN